VCRRSYIDPRIVNRFDDGETMAPVLRRLEAAPDMNNREVRNAIGSAVTDLVADEYEHSAAVAA
jgi:DNA topoisomerase I